MRRHIRWLLLGLGVIVLASCLAYLLRPLEPVDPSTWDAYARVRQGMTEPEVVAALARPAGGCTGRRGVPVSGGWRHQGDRRTGPASCDRSRTEAILGWRRL